MSSAIFMNSELTMCQALRAVAAAKRHVPYPQVLDDVRIDAASAILVP